MKRKLKIGMGIVILAFGIVAFGCKGTTQKANTETHEQMAEKVYTCSMHPEVEQKEPGKCPKCGMELVEKKMDMEHSHEGHEH